MDMLRSASSMRSGAFVNRDPALSRRLVLYLLGGFLSLKLLWQRHGEDAILEAGVDLIGIDAVGHSKGEFEGVEIPLSQVVVLFLLFLVFLLFALDGQD